MTADIPIGRRNCPNCGRDYSAFGNERVCLKCRKRRVGGSNKCRTDTPITPRQRQIALLAAQGLANKEIAYELHLVEGTVKVILGRVFRKAGVKSRMELAVLILTPMLFELGVKATMRQAGIE